MPSHTTHHANTKGKRKNVILRKKKHKDLTRLIFKSQEHTQSHTSNITQHLQFNVMTTTHFFDNHIEIN